MKINLYNQTKVSTIFLLIVLVLTGASCKKFLEIGTPPNSLTEDKAFIDSTTATSVVLALYSRIANSNPQNNSLVFNITKLGAMSADEGYYLLNTSFDNFKNNTLAAGNDGNLVWFELYQSIGRANYAIKGLETTTTLSTPAKNQLLGEAKFMRAWYYFYLVNFFGDVPLVINTDALTNSLTPRMAKSQVYQQIVTDLIDAKNLLTTTYPSIEKARVNKRVVSAFLARVYFYQQNWTGAETEASDVIGSGVYSIEANMNNVFIKTSPETIWQIANTTGVTAMGAEFIPSSATPNFVLYDTLVKAFETGDQRKLNWAKAIVYNSKTYYYPFKYKLRTGTTGNEYAVMIRLAELYLIRGEARAQQNNISGAQSDINIVRNRAGLPNTIAATQSTLLSVLEMERWVELFTEQADRWFNLKRTNRATAVLSLIKPSWQPTQQLYPLPLTDMTANPNLVNNPGY